MKVNPAIESFLEEYLFTLSDKEKVEFATTGYDVWGFGNDEAFSNRLITAILKSRKKATSSLYKKRSKQPALGSYGIITDHLGTPKCLIKYTNFQIKPFSKVTLEFAQEEGEGSGDLHEWAEEHRRFFSNESPTFNEETLILCTSFKLVFKAAPND